MIWVQLEPSIPTPMIHNHPLSHLLLKHQFTKQKQIRSVTFWYDPTNPITTPKGNQELTRACDTHVHSHARMYTHMHARTHTHAHTHTSKTKPPAAVLSTIVATQWALACQRCVFLVQRKRTITCAANVFYNLGVLILMCFRLVYSEKGWFTNVATFVELTACHWL